MNKILDLLWQMKWYWITFLALGLLIAVSFVLLDADIGNIFGYQGDM